MMLYTYFWPTAWQNIRLYNSSRHHELIGVPRIALPYFSTSLRVGMSACFDVMVT